MNNLEQLKLLVADTKNAHLKLHYQKTKNRFNLHISQIPNISLQGADIETLCGEGIKTLKEMRIRNSQEYGFTL